MSKNDITGDDIKSRPNSDTFNENFDRVFGVRCENCCGQGFDFDDEGEIVDCPICGGTGKVSAI